ncbi:MauE/DoxX family redox-associated membrane protein [Steroidobacter sp.]|uniref:MauE/DoxX family redox-associated membrane protein n=1 Tax=Steroidobacter sp. TaxID=1978227 RepID=UPI001A407E29|nr:MauE/DoxX family redox-associated membrane protein [Steroidobacter sp.]MBL8265112.1 hypothetical protein [Steroidobacter sp.]
MLPCLLIPSRQLSRAHRVAVGGYGAARSRAIIHQGKQALESLLVQLDPVVALTIRLGFLLLFGSALLHKIVDWSSFETTVRRYLAGLRPGTAIVRLAAGVIVFLEVGVVVLCAFGPSGTLAAAVTAGVLLAYGAAMYINIARGNVLLDCGCSWGARRPASRILVLRNVVLALPAFMLALPVASRPLELMSAVSVGAAVVTCTLIYAAVDQLLTHSAPQEAQ